MWGPPDLARDWGSATWLAAGPMGKGIPALNLSFLIWECRQ